MPRSFVDLDLEPLNCVDGDVRLVNSNTSQEGRLQVCFNRVWGTVCNDRFDSDDARVVCSQLSTQFEGPSTQTSAGVFTVSPFAGGEVLTGADSYGPGMRSPRETCRKPPLAATMGLALLLWSSGS